MKFHLNSHRQPTLVEPELLEIYQPVLGYEAIAVWLNIYHALINNYPATEPDLIQQMNIDLKTFRTSLQLLARFGLAEKDGEDYRIWPPLKVVELARHVYNQDFPREQKRRLITLVEAFLLRRGKTLDIEGGEGQQDKPASLCEQQADELATRFIKECKFIPNKQLRERFDLWFEEIKDPRLLEELLERTKRKVEIEGNKGVCPSVYADKIVRQWLVKGIKTYADLVRHDQEFHSRWEYYRLVEKELGRGFNTLTPAEREIVDRWAEAVPDTDQLRKLLKKVILSGEYQGKGAPGLAFIDKWLDRQGKRNYDGAKKVAYVHQHTSSELQQAIKRKTMSGLEDGKDER